MAPTEMEHNMTTTTTPNDVSPPAGFYAHDWQANGAERPYRFVFADREVGQRLTVSNALSKVRPRLF